MEIAALVVGIIAGLFVILFGSRGLLDLGKGIADRRRANREGGAIAEAGHAEASLPEGVTLPPKGTPALAPAQPAIYRHVFVGRQAEMTILQAAFDKAASSNLGVVLLDGPAGVGKTTLASHLGQYVNPRRGEVLVVGHSQALEDAEVLLAGRRPGLLVLDDMDLRDDHSTSLIPAMLGQFKESPCLVVAIASDELAGSVPDLRRAPGMQRIHLRGLSRDDVQRFADTLTSRPMGPEFASAIFAETEGNPLFAEELVRYLAEKGHLILEGDSWHWDGHLPSEVVASESPAAIVRQRVASLSIDCQAVLRKAAASGYEFDITSIAANESDARAAIDEATARHVAVHLHGGTYSFRHRLVREALRG